MLLSKSWFRRTCIVLLALLLALPWLVSDITHYLAVDWLEQQGIERADIEEFWVNPYAAVIELKDVTLYRDDTPYHLSSLNFDLSLRDLWSKKIRIAALEVSGLDVRLEEEKSHYLINGLQFPKATDDSAADIEPQVDEPQADEAQSDLWHFALDSLAIEDVTIQWLSPVGSAQVRLDSLTSNLVDTESTAESEIHMELVLEQLLVPEQQIKASAEVNYTALVDLKRNDSGHWSSSLLGNISIIAIEVENQAISTQLSRMELGLTTELSYGDSFSYSSNVETQISDFSLSHQENQQQFMSLNSLAFNTQVNSEKVSVENLVLAGFNFLPVSSNSEAATDHGFIEEAYLYLDRVTVVLPSETQPVDITVNQLTLAIADIYLDRNDAGEIDQLLRLNNLQSKLTEAFESSAQPEAELVAQEDTAEKVIATESAEAAKVEPDSASHEVVSPQFLIKRLTVESEVALHFRDQSIKPTFSESMTIDFIDIENVNLVEPLTIDMKIDLSHGASIVSKVDASLQNQSAKGSLALNNYELLAVSGYSELATGYALEAGRLSSASDFSVENEQLVSDHIIDISHLHLRPEHQDSMTKFTHQLTMPLDQAVDLLRDGDNLIHLEVPVSGEMNNPDVDLQQIINTALKGAMKKASLAVLSSLLQPYGAMISIAQMAGEEMTKVRLEPVSFNPGEVSLTPSSIDYVTKVGSMIRERPSLNVKLCSVTNAQDSVFLTTQKENESSKSKVEPTESEVLAANREQLQKMGHERALTVKSYLENQVGVNSAQLLMCLPKHLAEAPSGVELSI